MIMRYSPLLLVLPLMALAACGAREDKADLNQIDSKIAGKNAADPALTAALEDQIMVDPSLSGQANEDAIRTAPKPYQAPVPAGEGLKKDPATAPTLGDLASQQSGLSRAAFNGCGLSVDYAMTFAAQLPADFALMPKSQVIEAAGSDENGCKLRAVSHSNAAPMKTVARYYSGMAARAGYSVRTKIEGKGVMVSGQRTADGAAFYVILSPVGNGTQADLVINNGR